MRETTFGKLPVGTWFKFVPGILTFYKDRPGYYSLGPNGYGGLEYEAASTAVIRVQGK